MVVIFEWTISINHDHHDLGIIIQSITLPILIITHEKI